MSCTSSTHCGKCSKFLTYMDDEICCDGFCNHRFHISCANLSNYLKELISIEKHVKWFCDCCCDALTNLKGIYGLEMSLKTIKISQG